MVSIMENFETALQNVKDNETIKLLKDYTHKNSLRINEEIYLDLNNHDFNLEVDHGHALEVSTARVGIIGDGAFNIKGSTYGIKA